MNYFGHSCRNGKRIQGDYDPINSQKFCTLRFPGTDDAVSDSMELDDAVSDPKSNSLVATHTSDGNEKNH